MAFHAWPYSAFGTRDCRLLAGVQFLVSGGSGIPFPWVELCLGAGLFWLFGAPFSLVCG
jgi:hypothetical protein